MDYTEEELEFFCLWYIRAYARRKRNPPKEEKELYEKLIVDRRELEKDEDVFKDLLDE